MPLAQENEEYMFVSINVVSLFPNVLWHKTVNIIFKRVYNEKLKVKKVNSRYLPENRIIFQ